MKRRFVIGLAVVAAAAAGGGAYAAAAAGGSGGSDSNRQAFLNDVAKRLHVTPQQLSNALKGAAIDRLNAAVSSGRLTQAQANELGRRIEQGQVPFGGHEFRGPHGFGGPPFVGGPPLLGAAASYLGLTVPQLFQQLQTGKSLAQIASARGKSVSGLKSAITAQLKSRLDQAVTRGMISAAQERQMLSNLSSRLGDLINGIHRPGFGHGFMAPQMATPPPAGPNF
jgi:hypothetical protein